MEFKNPEQITKEITLEEGKQLRQEIYEKAKELFYESNNFIGELDPNGSLTIFNVNNELTRLSVIGVVEKFLARSIQDGLINKKDQENIEKFKSYLETLKE